MKKRIVLGLCGWFFCSAALTSPSMAQTKLGVSVSKANTSQKVTQSTADNVDESTLMMLLGIDEQQAAFEDQFELATLQSIPSADTVTLLTNPLSFDAPALGAYGPLNAPSPIRTKSRTGVWSTPGYIDLVGMLDASWALGSGMLEQQVRQYLVNARAEYHDFRLNGFYDISINLADATQANCTVYVSSDRKHMYLTYDIPGNQVQCTANLTSPFGWPDRDVRVTTTVRIEVAMDVTGSLVTPTSVRNFRLSLRDTECWNDGILFRETFNQRVENEVNAVSVPLPQELGPFVFGSVNTRLKTYITPRTTELLFEYNSSTDTVAFKLESHSISAPTDVFDNPVAGSLSK